MSNYRVYPHPRKQHIAVICALIFLFFILFHKYHKSSYIDDVPGAVNGIARLDTSSRQLANNAQPVTTFSQRIEDLKRIKISLNNEIRLIEKERSKLAKERNELIARSEKLQKQITRSKLQLKQLGLDIDANRKQKFDRVCKFDSVTPIIFNPLRSFDIDQYSMTNDAVGNLTYNHIAQSQRSLMDEWLHFDLSGCPLTREFSYNVVFTEPNNSSNDNRLRTTGLFLLHKELMLHASYIPTSNKSCLTIHLNPNNNISTLQRNNLVISIDSHGASQILSDEVRARSVVASTSFRKNLFRQGLDLILPSIWQSYDHYDITVGSLPPQSPLSRKYLAAYFGAVVSSDQQLQKLESILQVIHRNSISDAFAFVYECDLDSNELCYEDRERLAELSVFLIILTPTTHVINENTNDLVYLALSKGSIPVIVGREHVRLPFNEVIDWRLASIALPTSRLPELHFILRSFAPADLYALKYHGRRIFEKHLATIKQVSETLVSLISLERFNFPPHPVPDVKTKSHYETKKMILDKDCETDICIETRNDSVANLLADEIYGPREKPFESQKFQRNFSLTLNRNYDLWNNPMFLATYIFPSNPRDPIPPSEYKFLSTDNNQFRPISNGLGGSGLEFSQSLGGDHPNEQFTILLLTYERERILQKTLERLRGLAYLNKIVVIWNGIHRAPPDDMIWPDVGAPIVVVDVERNSLNNRFLPFDEIETDAIFSMDDDSPLRPDEIIFAFRVWRQSRDRIVGFPGRFHAWDDNKNAWMYNSNHSCELSMVLTGDAFFHKYYTYVYTYFMPESIRTIVDKFMNCEDIAMNFLVAHLTREPPIKVTSRWTFHCPKCPSSLSEDDSHFRERHECLNIFASIYGYMPLLNTQHRSDSILFKTRLPHDKQKCFKFV